MAIPDNAIGRIEINPTAAGQIGLHPSVCGSAACDGRIAARNEDIPADETSGDAQGSRGFHHKDSEVPAASAADLDCLIRGLYTLFAAPRVAKLFSDA